MVKGGADDLGSTGEFRIRRRVDFNLIDLALRVGHAETRLHACGLAGGNLPGSQVDALDAVRSSRDLSRAHGRAADAVGEPARVRDFVDCVDVERTNISSLPRLAEGVDDEVVAVGVLDRDGLHVQNAVVICPERIVGVEAW